MSQPSSPPRTPKRRRSRRPLILAGVLALIAMSAVSYLRDDAPQRPVDYLRVVREVQQHRPALRDLEISRGADVTLHFRDTKRDPLTAAYPDERSLRALVTDAQKSRLPVLVVNPQTNLLRDILIQLVPLVLVMGLLILLLRRASGMGKIMGGGRRFEATEKGDTKTTFADVAGLGEAREEVKEVVEFLRDHDRFSKLGARVPRGVLFVGPPGTGKTLLAKAVAGESDAAFFSLTGSDFVEMFAGLGANRVRKLFKNARESAPSIIFIDEIDAVGRQRSGSGPGGNDEREQTLNQLLSEMDGFAAEEAVVIIAATNRPDVLDAALLRPGRFDRQIHIDPPDRAGRLQILEVHAAGKPIETDQLEAIASQTPGFTGAQLANLLNEAAIIAARRRQENIDASCLDAAMLRVVAGLESPRAMSSEERSRIAYHEVGHALCAHCTEHRTPVQKISVVSRGRALGFTLSVPEQDRLLETRESLMDRLTMLLGGRAAELMIFGSASSGAANDLERATALAAQMVTRMGLSDKIGPRVVPTADESYVPGAAALGQLYCSPGTAERVENEILALLVEAQKRASVLLEAHRDDLERVTVALNEKETLEASEFLALLDAAEPATPAC